jgi:L-rhamnose-H+ transport protein
MHDEAFGLFVCVIAGAIGSALFVPMKFIREWPWEATWLSYSSLGYFLFPWIAAIFTVPDLAKVYADAGATAVGWAVLFGILWGAGVVMYGLAVDAVGLSLSSGLILGLSIAVGSLVPLVTRESAALATSKGQMILAADLVIIIGLALCGWAGGLREAAKRSLASTGEQTPKKKAASSPKGKTPLWVGLAMCVFSGATAPLISVALWLGEPVTAAAKAHGASPTWAGNAIWALTVSAGALPSIGYCAALLSKNRTSSAFSLPVARANLALCGAMGAAFIISTILYGAAFAWMGQTTGQLVGWPVYMASIIVGGGFFGWMTGEWKNCGRPAALAMLTGVLLQVAGIAWLAVAR